METNLHEWMNLVVRWFHVIAGIMWIGQTYFFNWMERRFGPPVRAEKSNVAGELWMVHSGGFYVVQKQRQPELMPTTLHWFKWESAMTWISGVLLLIIVYWTGGTLVDIQSGLSDAAGIGISVGVLVVGFAVYTAIWRSPLGRNEALGAAMSLALIVGLVSWLNGYLTPRAAYLHVGALFGTIMTANVWMTILPAQRQMIAATKAGKEPDAARAVRARRCTKHNTYMSVPLILLMISNHFPTATYGHSASPVMLGVLVLAGWGAAKLLRDVL